MIDAQTGEAELEPINLVDCGLEDVVAALLARQPIATSADGAHFVLDNDNSRKIFAYYARNRNLWPQRKTVRAAEIDDENTIDMAGHEKLRWQNPAQGLHNATARSKPWGAPGMKRGSAREGIFNTHQQVSTA